MNDYYENTISLNELYDEDNPYYRVGCDTEFLYEYAMQEQEMLDYINKKLILESGNERAIRRLEVFNEGVVDGIKKMITKIIDFIKSIFKKTSDRLTQWLGDIKKYMDKNADIIKNQPYVAGNVSDMYDHFTGYPLIKDQLENLSTDNSKIVDQICSTENLDAFNETTYKYPNDYHKLNVMKEEVTFDYSKTLDEIINTIPKDDPSLNASKDSNGKIIWNTYFQNMFNGGPDKKDFTTDEINKQFKVIYTTLNESIELLNSTQKFQINFEKTMNNVIQNVEQKCRELEKNSNNANAPANAPANDNKKTRSHHENISYTLHGNESILSEINIAKPDGKNDKPSMGSATADAQKMKNNVNASNDAASKMDKQITDKMNTTNVNDTKKYTNAITTRLNNYNEIMNGMITGLVKAFEATQVDYYAIIKAHVDYYLTHSSKQK